MRRRQSSLLLRVRQPRGRSWRARSSATGCDGSAYCYSGNRTSQLSENSCGGCKRLATLKERPSAIEYRDADGKYQRLPELADELVRLNPDLIFSFGGEQAPIAKKATTTIPIVVVVSNDPVESGLVASLGRPGGNITGLTYVHDSWQESQLSCSKTRCPGCRALPFCGIQIMLIPSFGRRSAPRTRLELQLQSLEVREPAILRARSRRQRASGPRLSSLSGPGSYFSTGSWLVTLRKRMDSSWSACRAG